jgi:hypothetical protein
VRDVRTLLAKVVVLAALFVSSACVSTTPRNAVFDGSQPGVAMVVLVVDGMPTGLMTSEYFVFGFRRVDLEARRFEKENFMVSFEPMGAIVDQELDKPRDMETSVRFGAIEVPAGDYFYLSRVDARHLSRQTTCHSLGAPVFRLEPGRVNIVALGSVRGTLGVFPAVVEKQARAVLAGYPGVTAPVGHARRMGSLKFAPESDKRRHCGAGSSFSFTPDS